MTTQKRKSLTPLEKVKKLYQLKALISKKDRLSQKLKKLTQE